MCKKCGKSSHNPNVKSWRRNQNLRDKKSLFQFAFNLTDCSNLDNDDLFEAATFGNDVEMKSILACNSIDINAIDIHGKTPLYLSAQKGHEGVVQLLISQMDIDVNKGMESGPLAGLTPLSKASHYGHEGVVKLLLAHQDIDVNKAMESGEDAGITPLWQATSEKHFQIVKLLLTHPEIDVNKGRVFNGMNPLLIAAGHGLEVVEVILKHPFIDVNHQRHTDGATPLLLATYHGQDSGITE